MLRYTWRVRDLVHGTILFTEEEQLLVNHPLFQRLRGIRQNDLTGEVFPSANTSRFEHALGVCHVAGLIAETLVRGPNWQEYAEQLVKAQSDFDDNTSDKFVRVARFYALLHDVGHFPFSHLFEDALGRYAKSSHDNLLGQWFGKSTHGKAHEAFGAYIVERLPLPTDIKEPIIKLMSEKEIGKKSPLRVLKRIIDGPIDADRIDFVRRDGLLIGGEYGNYDINRLSTSVMLFSRKSEWHIAFSDRAITSLEALLFDRYRIYTWVHFHRHAVTAKAVMARLIESAMAQGAFGKSDFLTSNSEELALKDDAWLIEKLRSIKSSLKDEARLMWRVTLCHERTHIFAIWDTRTEYSKLNSELVHQLKKSHGTTGEFDKDDPKWAWEVNDASAYEQGLGEHLNATVLYAPLKFGTEGGDTLLYDEDRSVLRDANLGDTSALVRHIPHLWQRDPNSYVILLGEGMWNRMRDPREAEGIRHKWLAFSSNSPFVDLRQPDGRKADNPCTEVD